MQIGEAVSGRNHARTASRGGRHRHLHRGPRRVNKQVARRLQMQRTLVVPRVQQMCELRVVSVATLMHPTRSGQNPRTLKTCGERWSRCKSLRERRALLSVTLALPPQFCTGDFRASKDAVNRSHIARTCSCLGSGPELCSSLRFCHLDPVPPCQSIETRRLYCCKMYLACRCHSLVDATSATRPRTITLPRLSCRVELQQGAWFRCVLGWASWACGH